MPITFKRRHHRMKGTEILDLCGPIEHVRDVIFLVAFKAILGSFGDLHFFSESTFYKTLHLR